MIKTYKNEQGRSMVEMLGVLAIIGVLSVAGIAGYTIAMNKFRANETINQAVQIAMMISAQRLTNPNAAINTNDFGTNFTVDNSTTSEIKLTLDNLPAAVRSKIQNMGLKNATISENNGSLTFTFNNDLSERSGGSGEGTDSSNNTCPADFGTHNGCQSCENGVISYAEEGKTCVDNGDQVFGHSACDGSGNCNACPDFSKPLDKEPSYGDATSVPGCYCLGSDPEWYNGQCND